MRCEDLAARLPSLAEGPGSLEPDELHHVERCLRCQADIARYRRLRRAMVAMGAERLAVPPDLAAQVIAGLDEAGPGRPRHRSTGRRAAYLGGLAAATAAGVGGVLVLANRRRPA